MKYRRNVALIIILIFFIIQLHALDKAPDFKLENMKGKQVKLSDYLEKGLVILDFWATWCAPCKKELPELSKLQEKYKDKITVLAVSVDKPRSKDKAKAHVKSQKMKFVTLFDSKKDVQKLYNITNIPRTLIIAPDCTILYDHTGYQRGDEKHLEKIIEKWIKESTESSEPDSIQIKEEENQENEPRDELNE